MRKFLRRQFTYFLAGFVIAFIIYLLIRFSAEEVLWGVVVGAAGGVALAIALTLLERRFPDEPGR